MLYVFKLMIMTFEDLPQIYILLSMLQTIYSRTGFYCQEQFLQWGIGGGNLNTFRLAINSETSFVEMIRAEKQIFLSFVTSVVCMLWFVTTPLRDIIVAKFDGHSLGSWTITSAICCCTTSLLVTLLPLIWVIYYEVVTYLERTDTNGGRAIFALAILLSILVCCSCCFCVFGRGDVVPKLN